MILDGCHFQYGDFNSRKYDLIFVHCDTSNYIKLMGDIETSYMFNRKDRSKYIIHDVYDSSPISFEAEIVSITFEPFSAQVRKKIERALFNKPSYKKLFVDMDDDFMGDTYEYDNGYLKRMYFNCRFMNSTKIEDGRGLVVGYKFTVQCDSCMAWQEPTYREFVFDGVSDSTISVDVSTDAEGYTYPIIMMQLGDIGGDITITNSTDDTTRSTKFVDLAPSTHITMKGNLNYISGQNYDKFSSQNFVRLLDGENVLNISGNIISMRVEWNNRKYL